MPDRDSILNRNRRDQAIRGRTNRVSPAASVAVELPGLEEQIQRQRIAQAIYGQEGNTKCIAIPAASQALQNLLDNWTARDEMIEIVNAP